MSKNMNFHRSILIVTTTLLISCFGGSAFAQKTNYLPENIKLSFNGTFQNEINDDFRASSENGIYKAKYEIGTVSDEMRELKNMQVYESGRILFTMKDVPGSDIYLSNAGNLAVIDMKLHYKQEVTIGFYDKNGKFILTQTFRYASLFGFSPMGEKFVVGTDKYFNIIDLVSNRISQLESCSQFAFSENEEYISTARENLLNVYLNFKIVASFNTGFVYPRGIAISNTNQCVYVIDKNYLKAFSFEQNDLVFEKVLSEHNSYRDIRIGNDGQILAGVHYRFDGISTGILHVYDIYGNLTEQAEISSKNYPVFKEPKSQKKSSSKYETIPWPFVPFDQVHKVWNHYEQHMGDGSGDWSYLHQGLDIEVPINEPVYAVEEGFVKLVLTLGGDSYWRLAISPLQVSGYSDGWLYAHLVDSTIQVDVGDTVNIHDYLGKIIYWTEDWGHIHFVQIHDQGTVWYYDDDEWGINFNPLLALDPITDNVAPVIQNFSASSKFGFCTNETSTYLNPNDLHGDVDIIVKISDYHGTSEWEQPAFKTYYWFYKLPENTNVFPKTLGQILNHTYDLYATNWFEAYAPLMYKKDNAHPSPPWMNWDRDYYQILTNNNGDSIAEFSELQLAFPTADYPDGQYRLFVEAWDEFGNMDADSMIVTFDNYTTDIAEKQQGESITCFCFPNPASEKTTLEFNLQSGFSGDITVSLLNTELKEVYKSQFTNTGSGKNSIVLDIRNFNPGVYYYSIDTGKQATFGKLIIL
jgi:murein DD-endopeptidase MepM/ murein hydrolase activator NlpD